MFRKLILVLVFGFPVVVLAGVEPARPNDGWAVVDCYRPAFTSVGNWNQGPKRNWVMKGSTLTWFLIGPTNTVVTFDFVEKDSCEATSPFEGKEPQLKHTIANATNDAETYTSPKVDKTVTKKCYGYKVTCTFPNGANTVIDPIIDIPGN